MLIAFSSMIIAVSFPARLVSPPKMLRLAGYTAFPTKFLLDSEVWAFCSALISTFGRGILKY
jgi:hypothetical protein